MAKDVWSGGTASPQKAKFSRIGIGGLFIQNLIKTDRYVSVSVSWLMCGSLGQGQKEEAEAGAF